MTNSEEKYLEYERIPENQPLKKKIFLIIFGTNTPKGKLFDLVLLVLIVVSVLVVLLESIPVIHDHPQLGQILRITEWVLTILFTIEYILRIWIVEKPRNYILSGFGIIDLLAILPTYLSLFLVGSQGLAVIRALRILRVFRILKLMRFVAEAQILGKALKASRHKITVFFLFLLVLVFIMGSLMYLVEGGESGFNSIPQSIYWAIVTLTTVGYGDVTPVTVLGKFIASFVMLMGYSIIAIPTGIIGSEVYKHSDQIQGKGKNMTCPSCKLSAHDDDANFCKNCGARLNQTTVY